MDVQGVDWSAITDEFQREREVGRVRALVESSCLPADRYEQVLSVLRAAVPDPGTDLDDGDEHPGDDVPGCPVVPDDARVHSLLRGLWDHAARTPGDRFVLALGLYTEVQRAWELSADTQAMDTLSRATHRTWREHRAAVGEDDGFEPALTDVLVRHHLALVDAFAMENGLNCSCALEAGGAAALVADDSAARLADLARLDAPPTAWRAPTALVRRLLAAHRAYFDGVRTAASTVVEHVVGAVDAREVRARAERLWAVQASDDLAGDVYRSELRSHAIGLRALAERLGTTVLDGLRFPDLTATYLFPFTTRGPTDDLHHDNADLLAAVLRHRRRLLTLRPRSAADGRERLGFAPVRVSRRQLSDIWSHGRDSVFSEERLEPTAYHGVLLDLPDVWIDPRHPDSPRIGPLRASVHLSSFGNHHVRFAGDVMPEDAGREAGYHDLNQAIRRGSGFMGAELVTMDGVERTFTSLGDLAFHLVRDLSGWDTELGLEDLRCTFDPAVDGHAMITASEAVVHAADDGGIPRDATGTEIVEAIGPMLLVPVERTAAGLEEWLRYQGPRDPASVRGFMGDLAPADSLAVQTARSTFLYLPGQPDWSTLGTGELVEFAVCSRALVRQWARHVQEAITRAGERLADRDGRGTLDSDGVREERLRAATQGSRVRAQRAMLHSEELVRSPGHRRILDLLLEHSAAERLEGELDHLIDELDALHTRLGDAVAAIEAGRTERYQQAVELVLFVLALFAMADLFSYVNDMVWSGAVPVAVARTELAVYGGAVVALAAWGWWGLRQSRA